MGRNLEFVGVEMRYELEVNHFLMKETNLSLGEVVQETKKNKNLLSETIISPNNNYAILKNLKSFKILKTFFLRIL